MSESDNGEREALVNEQKGSAEEGVVLRAGDLIDDRELASPSADRLDHERVADQLVDLVTTVETPTNVALYGPWGSGKSGISNLVQAKIDGGKDHKKIRFARFDAFKYAENPFRRSFIIAIANELGVEDPQFSKDLYAGKTNTTIKVPDERKWAIALWFLGLTVALVGVLTVLIGVLALFQSGSWSEAFSKDLSTALPGGLVAPALLAVAFTLVGKSLTVDRSVDKPESVEEFENLFVALVKASKADRLVIFVDELDRCSAKEVVATLDAIRTFLGVQKCVFIVAADQHVLEQALSEEARQETPDNSVNPYYSTGSAYLDKVFQYQISLPALLPQSVTGYAIELVDGRSGLWRDIAPVAYPVSVLIPSHVTSPRRVKHLLNTFALTYRLAESKHAAGRLRQSPREFTQALARLVCLRVEFPNFARDLTLDPRMPDYVLALYDDQEAELGQRVAPHVRERALAYATGKASPARLMDGSRDARSQSANSDEQAEIANDVLAETPAQEEEVRNRADREPATTAQQGRQLITYLTRTRLVDGPSRDLIYLHSVEAVYGLDDAISATLTPAVENGLFADIEAIFTDASEEQKPKVVQFIAGQIPVTFGIERLNAAHSLMRLALRDDLPNLPVVADNASQAIAEMHRSHEPVLTEDNIQGGWNLAIASDDDGADTLKRTVLALLNEQPSWDATFICDTPSVALGASNPNAVTVLARELTGERSADAARRLAENAPDDVKQVLNAIRAETGDHLSQLAAEQARRVAERQEVVEEAEAAGVEPDGEEVPDVVAPVIGSLEGLADRYINSEDDTASRLDIGWLIVHILLLGHDENTRHAVQRLLPNLATTHDSRTVTELLQGVQHRTLSQWPTWLDAIDISGIQQNQASAILAVAERLFEKATDRSGQDATDETVTVATDSFARITESDGAPDNLQLNDQALALLAEPVSTEEEAQARNWELSRVATFTTAGYVAAEAIAAQELATVRQTIAAGIGAQPDNSALTAYVTGHGPRLAKAFTTPSDEETAACIALAQEVRECAWLSERLRTQASVAVLANFADAATINDARELAQSNAPTSDAMNEFLAKHGSEASRSLADWIRLMRPDRATTRLLIESARDNDALNDESANAFRANTLRWDTSELVALTRHFVGQDSQEEPDNSLLHAIAYDEVEPSIVAEILHTRYSHSSSNAAKQTVISHWKLAPNMADQTSELYEKILMPWLRANTGGSQNADAVRRALAATTQLAVPIPDNLRNDFANLVAEATDGNRDLTKDAIPALETLGYSADRTGILHSRLKIDDD